MYFTDVLKNCEYRVFRVSEVTKHVDSVVYTERQAIIVLKETLCTNKNIFQYQKVDG